MDEAAPSRPGVPPKGRKSSVPVEKVRGMRATGQGPTAIAKALGISRWLATVYIPQHNARFAVAAAEEGTAFVPFVGALDTD